jgi:hypothetical protein
MYGPRSAYKYVQLSVVSLTLTTTLTEIPPPPPTSFGSLLTAFGLPDLHSQVKVFEVLTSIRQEVHASKIGHVYMVFCNYDDHYWSIRL